MQISLKKLLKRRRFLQFGLSGMALAIFGSCSSEAKISKQTLNQKSKNIILVIGAGVSGLAAARELQSSGFEVIVLEGRDRIGGRIYTNQDWGFPIDLGASWIHGQEENPITKLTQNFNIKTKITDYDNLKIYSQGKSLSDSEIEAGANRYESLKDRLKSWGDNQDRDVSIFQGVRQFLDRDKLTAKQREILQWWLASEIEMEMGMDLKDLSLWEWDEDEAFEGDDLVFPEGYAQIPQQLSAGIQIKLGHSVTEIADTDRGVTVTTNQGKFQGIAAIITLPLGVLKSGNVKFLPPLPDRKQTAIQRLTIGVLNKVVLKFSQPFWDQVEIIGNISKTPTDFPYFINWDEYTDKPALIAITGGSFARRLEGLTDHNLASEVMNGLKRIYGDSIPQPEAILRTKWASDPFSFGSYSNLPVGTTARERTILAEPIRDRLFFAGEATSSEYPATVHGAFLSGIREAKRVIEFL